MNDLAMVVTRPAPLLHFARIEIKYLLPALKRIRVERDLRYFLEYDEFVAVQPDHRYFVRSLYFDDPSYSAFHDKIDGLHTRSKFRVRTYSQSPNSGCRIYLEVKGRHNNLVFKHRTPILSEGVDWSLIGDHSLTSLILKSAADCPLRRQFEYDVIRKKIRPVALIDYLRRPYISKYDPGFRLTFDEKICATKTRKLFPDDSANGYMVRPGYTVLEVKFKSHIPSWFHQVIQAHELQRISISKIVSGMEVLGMASDEQ